MSADRYSRQTLFRPIGAEGQKRIRGSRVTLVGCGALGSAIADHLVRAGVGTLRICDRDFVELSNLQRQTLFDEEDVRENLPKAVAAVRKLRRINSEVAIEERVVDVGPANIEELVSGSDLVMDGTDNFETRFLLNDACVKQGIPWVYGGCVGSTGMVMGIHPGVSACYACLLSEPPPAGSAATCDTAGVIGPAVAVVAGLQCSAALRFLSGERASWGGTLVTLDVWSGDFNNFSLKRAEACRVCVGHEYPSLDARESGAAVRLCGRNAVQVTPARPARLDLAELESRLRPLGRTARNDYLVKSWLESCELSIFADGRAIVQGTDDPTRARALYAKYIGA